LTNFGSDIIYDELVKTAVI